MKVIIAISLCALAGCGTMNMTPDQITAMASTSSNLCFNGSAWNGAPTTLSYSTFGGKSAPNGGGGTAKCGNSEVTFTSSAPK